MGILDKTKDMLSSSDGNNLINKATDKFGNRRDDNQMRGNQQGSDDWNPDQSRGRGSDKYGDSDVLGGRDNDDYSNQNRDTGYQGQGVREPNSTGYGDSGLNDQSGLGYESRGNSGADSARDGLSDNLGARGGVNSRGVENSSDSVTSGGYGTNRQGDSYSKMNQSGFDNQDSGLSGY